MNKSNPKKIMEIIYIFILPLLFILFNIYFTGSEDIQGTTTYITKYMDYFDAFCFPENPIVIIFEYIFDALNVENNSIMINVLIDYITLWFIMFITWHLLYLFFNTIMHKVLLRKE